MDLRITVLDIQLCSILHANSDDVYVDVWVNGECKSSHGADATDSKIKFTNLQTSMQEITFKLHDYENEISFNGYVRLEYVCGLE